MKWSREVEQRVEAYLREVEQRLAHKPAAVRQEVVSGLRDHIAEAMNRAREKGEEGLHVAERILAEMDPPETFAEAAAEVALGATAELAPDVEKITARHWFALAVAFLLVNAYGVWRWTSHLPPRPIATAEASAAGGEEQVYDRVLRLRRMEQVDVSPERELVLRLTFSDRPDREQLTRHLKLSAPGQGKVDYRLMGAAGPNTLLVRTESVRSDKLEYALAAGMPSAGESRVTDKTETGSLAMQMNILLRRVEAESPSFDPPSLIADFNAAADLSKAADYITIEPEVSFTVAPTHRWRWDGVRLNGDFQPGGIYTVTFKEGLPAANGSSLPQDATRTVHFPPRGRAVRLDSPGRYLAPGGALAVPVLTAGLERYEARLSPVMPNNLVHLALRESGRLSYWGGATAYLTGTGRAQTNALKRMPDGSPTPATVALRSLTDGDPRGVYWLEVGGEKASGDSRLLVVSDLGLAARVDAAGLLAWVNELGTAEPVAGAVLTVFANNNQVLARGETDEHGLARLALPKGEEPFLVLAESAGDWTYIDLDRTRVHQGEGLEGVPYLDEGRIEAAVFTERGVYRPGETVFVQAIARNDQMQAPPPFPGLLRVRRPDGRIFRDIPVELDEAGSATTEVVLPEYLPTGRYELELAMPGTHTVLGRTRVSMEDFVPPQIRADVDPPEGRFRAGDVLLFRVRGAHLFGGPASGLRVNAGATFTPEPFAPARWRGWRFGDAEKSFEPIDVQVGAGRLDADGAGQFDVDTRKAWRPPAALKVLLRATVVEASGRSMSAYGSALIDPYPFYVGMKPSWNGAVRVGETQRVAVVQVAPDGEPVATGKPLVLTLSRVAWNSVLRQNHRGRYEWVSEREVIELRSDTLAAGGEPMDWEFTVDGPGDYMLLAADPASGAATRLSFHAASTDPSWAAWSREKPGVVELAWDRDRYRPGDTARLQVRAPFAGQALLTIETDRVREARVVTLEKNTAELDIAVEESYFPNAWCTLTMIRPARAAAVWSAHRAIGAIALPVDRPETVVQVALDAPTRIRPQSPLAGTVRVRHADGSPAAGRVTVMAVDEGICLLTGFPTPDPMRIFAARRALGVSAFDLYAELMPIVEELLESAPAPGGDGEGMMRGRLNPIKANRFKPVALWAASLPLDENGRAAFHLDVPEFSGELRLMAVAYNDRQTGSASMPVTVKRDLVVQPALPRFLAIGDQAEAAIPLHNGSGETLSAIVRATCGGPLRAEVAETRVEIAAGQSVQVALPLTAGPGPGKALCTIEVVAGEETYRETIELAVRPAAGLRVETALRVLAPGERATFDAPAGWLPEALMVSGGLSPMPSVQMGRALDYVVHYPYGCLEQTVSGAFPLLFAGEWVGRLLPSEQAIGEISAWVPAAISRVFSMQQEGGGFALWPFSTGTGEEVSAYALHFLVEAGAAGFDVPAGPLDAALGWARGRLDRSISPDTSEQDWTREMQLRAYLCHILALAGRPDAGWAARLREQSDRLNPAARVHVASALLIAGEPRQAVDLLETLAPPPPRERQPSQLLDSDIRDAALLLAAWLDIEPENPAVVQLAQTLRDRQRDGHWGNTQDNAMALLAFGKLASRLPDEEQPVAGELVLPNGRTQSFSGTNDVTWSLGPGEGGPVTVRNDGPGRLYLWVRHEGVALTPEEPSARGVAIERELLDLAGNSADPARLSQGEMFVVRLSVDPRGGALDHLVIEDLLPAGLEIENPNLAASQQVTWLQRREENDRYRDARDDRMLIFTGHLSEKTVYHYAVRAVTPGVFALPPVVVSGMYQPEIRGVGAGGEVRVVP